MMRSSIQLLAAIWFLTAAAAARPPDVLMIAIDDLNDMVGCMPFWPGQHEELRAKTPHIDRLAERGTLFVNAHCQAPICNPSRASLMTGRLPSTTGIYYLSPLIRDCESTRNLVTLPQHFAANGYHTIGIGKLFHQKNELEFDDYLGNFGGFGPRPKQPISAGHTHPLWDWGAFPQRDEQMPDYKIATKACEILAQESDQPRFLAVGFHRPHVPMCVPQKWFDLYDREDCKLAGYLENDLDDVPQYGQDLSWSAVAPRHSWMVENNQVEHAIHSYLACVSFVDAQVGRLLDALDESPHAENTIVVLWSDHGFHLGTKDRWGKRSLWDDATRVPLVFAGPGVPSNRRTNMPVGLIDIYPTFIDLCELPPQEGLEGYSLTPLLSDELVASVRPVITTFGQHNHSVRWSRGRLTQYIDGSREFYDYCHDSHELQNLVAASPPALEEYVTEKTAVFERFFPEVSVPMAPGSKHADARPGSAADIDGPRNAP